MSIEITKELEQMRKRIENAQKIANYYAEIKVLLDTDPWLKDLFSGDVKPVELPPTPKNNEIPNGKVEVRRPHVGFAARVLRYLYTGPTTTDNLVSALGIHKETFNHLSGKLKSQKLVVLHNDVWSIGPKGKELAEWFVKNPKALVSRIGK